MNEFRCYTRQELKSFVLGHLPNEKTDEISSHLDQCDICEDTIVSMENTSDDLVSLLHGKPNQRLASDQPVYENNGEFQRALAKSYDVFTNPDPDRSNDSVASSFEYQPQRIGDYEIIAALARGGMGSVYKARHVRLEKEVALKLLPERKMQNNEAIARFSREMKLIGQMSHPAMVSATDAGAQNGVHYLAMELVDGIDLGKLVRHCGPLSVADACELVRQAAIGIQYAHEQGVIHRDVKPSNLMLSNDLIVKVLDLGLATLGSLNGTVDELTTVGQLMGTLDYMAPEQCGNMQDVDARADIYGLGATLYKLLCGVAPYSSAQNDTPLKKLKAMAISDPTPISDRTTKVPAPLATIIERCLSREPSDRFESAADLAQELASFCQEHDLQVLLDRAEKSDFEISNINVAESPLSSLGLSVSKSRPAHKVKPKSSPRKQSSGNWGSFIKAAMYFALAGLIGWGGIVLYINTSTGQLIIESEVDDVSVSILKNDVPTSEIQVEHGSESTRLRAGEYQIVINGDSDSLTIDNDQFVLKRGAKVIARIKKKADVKTPAQNSIASNQVPPKENRNFVHTNYQKRLVSLLQNRAMYFEPLGDAHPGTVLMDELIKETRDLAISNQATESHVDNTLFDLRKKLAANLCYDDREAIGSVKRQIATLEEYKNSISIDSRLPARDSNSNKNSNSPSQVTYNGRTLEDLIAESLQPRPNRDTYQGLAAIRGQLSIEELDEIAHQFIERYQNEVTDSFHIKLVRSLAQLCKSERVVGTVVDHIVKRSEKFDFNCKPFRDCGLSVTIQRKRSFPIQALGLIESENQADLIKRMDKLILSQEPSHRSLAIAWAGSQPVDKESKLSELWVEPLVNSLTDPSNSQVRLDAVRTLLRHFADKPKTIDALYDVASTNEIENLFFEDLELLIAARPKDTKLAKKLIGHAETGNCSMDLMLEQALSLESKGIPILLEQIEMELQGDTWGTSYSDDESAATGTSRFGAVVGGMGGGMIVGGLGTSGLGGGSGGGLGGPGGAMGWSGGGGPGLGSSGELDGDSDGPAIELPRNYPQTLYTSRQQLIKAIGNWASANTSGSERFGGGPGGGMGLGGGSGEEAYKTKSSFVLSKETKQRLENVLRSQFELKFSKLSPAATNAIYAETDLALAWLLESQPLHNGHDLEHWLDLFLQADPADQAYTSQWSRSLRGVVALKDQSKNLRGLLLDVIPKFRHLSFSEVDENDETSNAAVALALSPKFRPTPELKLRPPPELNDFTRVVIENFDEFNPADTPYLLWVLRRSSLDQVTLRNDSEERIARFILDASEAQDSITRRRALSFIVRLSFLAEACNERIFSTSSSIDLQPNQQGESLASNDDERLEALAQFSMLGIGINKQLTSFTLQIKEPRQIAKTISIFTRFQHYKRSFEPFYTKLLADNPKCIDEVHQTYDFDLWTGEPSEPVETTRNTLFEKVLEQVDSPSSPLFGSRQRESKITKKYLPKAIENLRARQSRSSGATKRKLDRLLRRIDPEAKKDKE